MDKCKETFGIDLDLLIRIAHATSIFTIGREYKDPYWRYLNWDKIRVNLSERTIEYTNKGDEDEYLSKPLSEYGKTWAINADEFEDDEVHGIGAKTCEELIEEGRQP